MADDFKFDLAAKRTRLTDENLMAALQAAAKTLNERYFTSTQYDQLPGRRPHSATVVVYDGDTLQRVLAPATPRPGSRSGPSWFLRLHVGP